MMLERVLALIDACVEEPLTVAEIARYAGYSTYHFSRMFSARMGISVMDYVRKRKLQHAAVRLLAGERVLDVAVRYGFETHEGFTRAFRRLFQIPPSSFRTLHAGPYNVPAFRIPEYDNEVISMEVRFETWADKRLIGYRFHTTPGSAELLTFWHEVMRGERWDRLRAKSDGLNYGLCIHPETMPEGKMDYLIAFDYDGQSEPDADMELFDLPAAQYAVFDSALTGSPFPAGIKAAWTYAYAQWFPDSGYTYDGDKPDFEVYRAPGCCEIYIPIIA